MKKSLLIIILIISLIPYTVKGDELPDITDDIEIRTKWYKEELIEKYYPKGEALPGYLEDQNKKSYSNYGAYHPDYCTYPKDKYDIIQTIIFEYKNITFTQYIKFINFEYNDNITIVYEGEKEDFNIISNDNNELVIELNRLKTTPELMLFVDYNLEYDIEMYFDKELTKLTLKKHIANEKVLIPDRTWVNKNSTYYTTTDTVGYSTTGLVNNLGSTKRCRYRTINTYRYKIEKHYYDDNYYNKLDVEGYIPDMTDFKIYYKGEELIKTVEVPIYEKVTEYITKYKTIEVPKEIIKTIKVEVPVEVEVQKDESNKETDCPEPLLKEQVKYIDKIKKIYKTPKYMYLIIGSLSLIIITLSTILIKKMSTNN